MFLLTLAFGIIILSIASYIDLKTREVPDYLSNLLICGAMFIRVLWFLAEKDIRIISWIPLSFLILGAFSYLMYKSGQWGGGDVKVMLGLSILFSSFPGERIPFFFNYLFNVLIVGAIYGILSVYLLALKKKKIHEKAIILPVAFVLSLLFFLFLSPLIAFLSFFIIISLVALFVLKDIEKELFECYVSVKKLTEGDWLVNDVKYKGKLIVKKRSTGLTLDDIKKIKKCGIKRVKIKSGIPFVPVFLISLILTLVLGNLMFLFV
ncbi:MAG: prepilin peptidase [Nanoarchaeota archaeon]|nr:prepilin peptidase [Nanoarchaeota archaeon]